MKNFTTNALLLAAGASLRMQQAKAFLPLYATQNFLQKCVHEFEDFGCQQIVVVVNTEINQRIKDEGFSFSDKVAYIVNPQPERGRFSSIQLGMSALKASNAVFIHNVDNPFVNQDLLQNLIKNLQSDYVHPVYHDKGGHPILLSTAIAKHIISAPENQDFKDLLSRFQKQTIEVDDPKVLANINTPNDYQFWLSSKL